jgi:hypothetical protein
MRPLNHRGLGKAIKEGLVEAKVAEGQSRVQEIIEWSVRENPGAKRLTLNTVLSNTDIKEAYVYYKQLSFDAGHPSITAPKRHFVESVGIVSLKPPIEDGEGMNTAFYASMALLGGCIAANEAFGRTVGGDRLEGLVAEFKRIAARTHAA